jgi:hypothetical protein
MSSLDYKYIAEYIAEYYYENIIYINDVSFNKSLTINNNFIKNDLSGSSVLVLDSSQNITTSSITDTELSYVDASSNIQDLLDDKPNFIDNSTTVSAINPKIVYGTVTTSSSASTSVNFFTPSPFSTTPIVLGTIISTSTTNVGTITFSSISSSGFSINVLDGTNRVIRDVYWIAIGF